MTSRIAASSAASRASASAGAPGEEDIRRKRIRVRAWRRGMREMDILMGGFVEERLATLGEAELTEFEALLELPDA
ncbi:MAG: succinate dehydrogenase assembly factor 2, partial [Allosphingosinicella sp.]